MGRGVSLSEDVEAIPYSQLVDLIFDMDVKTFVYRFLIRSSDVRLRLSWPDSDRRTVGPTPPYSFQD